MADEQSGGRDAAPRGGDAASAAAPGKPADGGEWRWKSIRAALSSTRFLLGSACVIVIALAILLLSHFEVLPEEPEHWSADQRTARLSARKAAQDPRIALVLVTDRTLSQFPYSAPVDRGLLADVIRHVSRAGPTAIGVDFIFDRPTEPAKDERLIAVLKDAAAPVIVGEIDEAGRLTAEQLAYQRNFLARTGRPRGHLFFEINRPRLVISDQVIRFTLERPGQKSLPELLAEAGGHVERHQARLWGAIFPVSDRIAWLRPPSNGSQTFLTLDAQSVIDLGARNEPDMLKDMLGGRIVLVGVDVSDRDQHLTPLSVLTDTRFPGVFIQAQIVGQLLDGRAIHALSWGTELIALLVVAGVGFYLGSRYRLWREEFIVEIIGAAVLVALGFLTFAAASLIIPYTSLLLAWLAGTIAGHHRHWIAERLRLPG